MKDNLFMTADDIVEVTGMSIAYAYKLIKQLNEELEKKAISRLKEESVVIILKKDCME